MNMNMYEIIKLTLSIIMGMILITTAFSGNATSVNAKSKVLIEPTWQDRYNLVGLLMSDGTGGYDFDGAQGFTPFEAHTAIGPDDAVSADQLSYFLESSIFATGTAGLQTEPLPQVDWAVASSGSLFYVVFDVTEPVKFTIIGQISARASSPTRYIESKAAVRFGSDGSSKYILDHYIEVNSGEKTTPFAIKGTLEPGTYYMSAWATGYFDLPGKSFSHETAAKSGYFIDLKVCSIEQ